MNDDAGRESGAGTTAGHWFVSGRVQGVGFRYYTRDVALSHGVKGDVQNLPDGRVEIRCVGGALDLFLALVRTGPRGSRVEDVEQKEPRGFPEFEDFRIRF